MTELCCKLFLMELIFKIQLCESYNTKYMIALTQIIKTEILAFIAFLVFKLLNDKVLFINRKDNRNCPIRLLFKNIANFTGKLLQDYKYLECKIFQDTFETPKRSFISTFSFCMTLPLICDKQDFLGCFMHIFFKVFVCL